MTSTARTLGATAPLTISLALGAPLTAFACSGGSAASSGSGLANPLGFDFSSAIYVALAGFLFLAAQLAIPLAVTMRRRRLRNRLPGQQLSPDGRYWWDGRMWCPIPTLG